ncbi:hypothetical protein DRQ25_09315 [Candidatus Fermentibacteria bacterium]|nr:MAG: hypothetical protein DRQ25_09315 [Candidatus Fermentibacteria bacterium]
MDNNNLSPATLKLVRICFLVAGTTGLFILNKFTSEAEVDPHEAVLRLNSGMYRPYVLWRASPTSVGYATIQHTGLRVVPGSSDDPSAVQVFVFGGSTMVGWQTSDSVTICAHMQRNLALTSDRPVCVTNFAQQGYVNTQELIELQLQLRAGNVPDLVIFYDGTNEIWSAVATDTAGVHFYLQEIADIYENRHFTRECTSAQNELLHLAGELSSVHFLRRILGIDTDNSLLSLYQPEPSRCSLYGEDFVDPAEFAEEIMGIYEGDLRILQALSEEFDFECRVFWQPVILTGNKPLSAEEKDIYDLQDSFVLLLYQECELLAMILESRYDNFFCETDIFDNTEETVFLDLCHLNSLGDSLIADRILSSLPPIF